MMVVMGSPTTATAAMTDGTAVIGVGSAASDGGVGRAGRLVLGDGEVVQAFQFAVDLSDAERVVVNRQFGGRRFAYNWTVAVLKGDIERFHAVGEVAGAPSFYGMRKRWHQAKATECVDSETGELWWPAVSKEAFANGVNDAVDGFWRWQQSRAGRLAGRRVGFPRFHKRGRDADRYTITTGSFGLVDRRHVRIPKVGVVRIHENARRLHRLIVAGRARVLAMTVRRRGDRILVSLRVAVIRPQRHHKPTLPGSRVGVDVGVRCLATVANADGEILARVDNPAPLAQALGELRRLCRQRSRRSAGSSRYRETNHKISVLHARIGNIRRHHISVLTTSLAKTHGEIVVEGLDAAGMLHQKGLPGARARRRRLADAALGEPRRQLRYKCGWYGSELIEADRWFASSKTCHRCDHVQPIGWAEHWTCDHCGVTHQHDDNAAINLARWHPPAGDLGSVGAPVKQRAEHKTRPRRAAGEDLRKRPAHPGGEQPRDGVPA
jgi:putative transposase